MSQPSPDTVAALARADMLCSLRRFPEAGSLASQVIASEPNNPGAWCVLARAYLGQGQDKEALVAARTAISQAPEDDWPLRLLNIALLKLGRTDEAIDAAQQAVRVAPHNWQTHGRLAQTLSIARGKASEALSTAERAVALAPDHAEPHVILGNAALAAQERDQAEAAFRRALAIDPQSATARNGLAALDVRKRSPASLARAAGGFASAVASDPRSASSRMNLDVAMRRFIALFAYFVFLDAYLLARITASSNHPASRLAPILVLALPAAYAARFVLHLSSQLRQYLARLLIGPGPIRTAAAAEAVAVLLLITGALASQHSRPTLSVLAALAALSARIMIYAARRRANAAAQTPRT